MMVRRIGAQRYATGMFRKNYYKVIHQINVGVAEARNTGFASAVGEYVVWVYLDDYITDDW